MAGHDGPSVLEAGNRAPEIPAARTLAEISADRRHVPESGRRDEIASLGQRGKLFADERASRDVGDARRRANAHTAVLCSVDSVSVSDGSEIHDDVGFG